jgi:hypothetical protein
MSIALSRDTVPTMTIACFGIVGMVSEHELVFTCNFIQKLYQSGFTSYNFQRSFANKNVSLHAEVSSDGDDGGGGGGIFIIGDGYDGGVGGGVIGGGGGVGIVVGDGVGVDVSGGGGGVGVGGVRIVRVGAGVIGEGGDEG